MDEKQLYFTLIIKYSKSKLEDREDKICITKVENVLRTC